MKDFAEVLTSLRERRGWTQEELAKRAGVSPGTIMRGERDRGSPSLETIGKLCQGMGISITTLAKAWEGEATELNELIDLILSQPEQRQQLAMNILAQLFKENP